MATSNIFFSNRLSKHATARDIRELYEGIPDVVSGGGRPNESSVTAPSHYSRHAWILYHRNGMLKHKAYNKVLTNKWYA